MRFVFTPDAKEHLMGIVAYIALDNPGAAEQVQIAVLDTCDVLAGMPDMGYRPRYVEDAEVYCFNVKQFTDYHIFYKKREDHILILAVLHGARDLKGLLNT